MNDAGGDEKLVWASGRRSHESDHVEDLGTERLLPEEIDESLTDLLFGAPAVKRSDADR